MSLPGYLESIAEAKDQYEKEKAEFIRKYPDVNESEYPPFEEWADETRG